MKKSLIFSILPVCFMCLSLAFVSCNTESGDSSVDPLIFTGTDIDGNSIEIEIIRPNGRAALIPQKNDQYKIRINNIEVSGGTIDKHGSFVTFKPDSGFEFCGELAGQTLFVSVIPEHSTGIMAGSASGVIANTEFNVTAGNFDSTIKSIRDIPGEYVINLSGDLLNYHGTYIGSGVKITVKGTGTNQITWKYDSNEESALFDVYGGYLVLEDIILGRVAGNAKMWSLLCVYNGIIAIRDGVTISGGGGINEEGGVCIKGGAFIMSGGEIKNFHSGLGVEGNETSLVITGGTISDNSDGIGFGGSDAFLTIVGGTIRDNNVGIYMDGSGNNVVMSGGAISFNDCGFAIGGSGNIVTITGGTIDNNKYEGVMAGSEYGRLTLTGGFIESNGDCGVSVGCSGFFQMTGGIIRGNKKGVIIFEPNSSFMKTGGTIYGIDAGLNSNEEFAISLDYNVNDDNGYTNLYVNADGSEVYAATINAAGDGLAPGSLKGTGWVAD